MVFLNQKFYQFNPELQVISQSTILTTEDTGIKYYLILVVKEYLLLVIFPLILINEMQVKLQ
jgi:hypothetical protein